MRSRWVVALTLGLALLVTACSGGMGEPRGADEAAVSGEPGEQYEDEGARSPADEAEEEAEEALERVEAYEQAVTAGEFARAARLTGPAPDGWTSVHAVSAKADDWEPAVAADPKKPFVYVLTTRYGIEKGCTTHCRLPHIPLIRSTDGGKSWQKPVPLCSCRDSHGQYDPTIEVVPNTGDVYTAYLPAAAKMLRRTMLTPSSRADLPAPNEVRCAPGRA